MTLFSGAGGIILPTFKYFSVSLSCSPRKSLNLRVTENSFFLNNLILVLVVTLYAI